MLVSLQKLVNSISGSWFISFEKFQKLRLEHFCRERNTVSLKPKLNVVMYKTIFVINNIIYMCSQHSNVL